MAAVPSHCPRCLKNTIQEHESSDPKAPRWFECRNCRNIWWVRVEQQIQAEAQAQSDRRRGRDNLHDC